MPPKKKPFIIVVENSIGYDKPNGGRTKSLNVIKKLYDALGVEVIVMPLYKFEDETRRGFKPENTTKAKLLASGRIEYKKDSVPKGSHKMPDGSIMKDSDMNKKKPRKVKITTLKKKLTSGELRKLISNHNKLTKIKIPKGTDYAGLEKIISDAGFTIDHENKKLISTGKSKEIPLPKPETMEEKEEKKKVAVERKRQKAIKVLTDKNVKKQEKKNIIKGAVALKKLVGQKQEKKKQNIKDKKQIERNRMGNKKVIESFLKKWKDGNYSFKGNGENNAMSDYNFFSPLTLDKFMKGLETVAVYSMDISPNYKTDKYTKEKTISSYSYQIKYEFGGRTSTKSYPLQKDKEIKPIKNKGKDIPAPLGVPAKTYRGSDPKK